MIKNFKKKKEGGGMDEYSIFLGSKNFNNETEKNLDMDDSSLNPEY